MGEMRSPPIWRLANQMLLAVELAARRFPRYHKYSLGTEMRHQALRVLQSIHRAESRRQRGRIRALQTLVEAIDDLKIQIQLARQLNCYASHTEFQRLAEMAVELGRQGRGWYRKARAGSPPRDRGASL